MVALFVSERRDARFDFTSPFHHIAHGIFAASTDAIPTTPDDLSGMRVAVVADGYAQNRLNANPNGGALIPLADISSALLAVAEDRADIAVVATHTARRVIAEGDLDIHQVSPPFCTRAYAFAVKQGRDELHAWLEQQVGLLQANGTHLEIHADWLSEMEWQPLNWRDYLRQLGWVALPLLLLGATGYLWSWLLRRQVARKTKLLSRELESRQSLQRELQYRLEHDMLTKLPNRIAFVARLDELIRRRVLAVAMARCAPALGGLRRRS